MLVHVVLVRVDLFVMSHTEGESVPVILINRLIFYAKKCRFYFSFLILILFYISYFMHTFQF